MSVLLAQEKVGEGRDKMVFRPKSTTPLSLELFEFLGLLFGCCLRTGQLRRFSCGAYPMTVGGVRRTLSPRLANVCVEALD